jgi:DNA-binding SARP family transcriptional activator
MRQKIILALLLLNANQVVPMEQIAEAIWGEDLPRQPANQIAICVSALRRALTEAGAPKDVVQTRSPGYLIRVDDERLDIHRVNALHARARALAQAGDRQAAVLALRAALTEWRGAVLAGIDSRLMQPEVARWEERRLSLLEECVDLEFALGRYGELIGELSAVVATNPLRERPRWQLMLALFRADRQADALSLYQDTHRMFEQELGLTPGSALRELNEAILRGTVAPRARRVDQVARSTMSMVPVSRPVAAAEAPAKDDACGSVRSETAADGDSCGPAVPRMLPARSPYFTGRTRELDALTEQLSREPDGEHPEVQIAAVCGPGGIGKTSLAVSAAHRLQACFVDGQLYANLNGAESRPLEALEVLAVFLRELGVDNATMPDDLEQRAAMYRSVLANRRVLVVLDNAAGEGQVRPLLPGSASCAVLLTSRVRLTAIDGVRLLELGLMPEPEVIELVRKIVGPERVDEEREATVKLVRYCGRLPLAVRIVSARLAARRHQRLDRFVKRLANQSHRLDELAHGSLDVRTSIELSYRSLRSPAKRLFRRLGLVETLDFAAWVGVPLMEADAAEAEELVDLLVDAQLLEFAYRDEAGQLRYRFHDLVRLYARERAEADETDAERRAAVSRMLSTWLALVERAHVSLLGGNYLVVHGTAPRIPLDRALMDELMTDPALWYETERRGIVATVQQASAYGFTEHCWDIAVSAMSLFGTRSHYDEWRRTHRTALAATRAASDPRGEAMVLTGLGDLCVTQHRYPAAREHLESALRIFAALDEHHGYGVALRKAAYADWINGDIDAALTRYEKALKLLREADDEGAVTHVVRWMGQLHLELGDLELARSYLAQALALSAGSRRSYAQALYRVGELALATGEVSRAEAMFTEVLSIAKGMRDRCGYAYALHGLGVTRLRQGRPAEADPFLTQARMEASVIGDRLIEIPVLLAFAEQRHAIGRPGEVDEMLSQAIALCQEIKAPLWLRRCHEATHRLSARWPALTSGPAVLRA